MLHACAAKWGSAVDCLGEVAYAPASLSMAPGLDSAEDSAMHHDANPDPLNLRLAALLAQRGETLRDVEDCEGYLRACGAFNSDE